MEINIFGRKYIVDVIYQGTDIIKILIPYNRIACVPISTLERSKIPINKNELEKAIEYAKTECTNTTIKYIEENMDIFNLALLEASILRERDCNNYTEAAKEALEILIKELNILSN